MCEASAIVQSWIVSSCLVASVGELGAGEGTGGGTNERGRAAGSGPVLIGVEALMMVCVKTVLLLLTSLEGTEEMREMTDALGEAGLSAVDWKRRAKATSLRLQCCRGSMGLAVESGAVGEEERAPEDELLVPGKERRRRSEMLYGAVRAPRALWLRARMAPVLPARGRGGGVDSRGATV